MRERAEKLEVLATAKPLVDGRELARQRDPTSDLGCLRLDVVSGDPGLSPVGGEQRREDPDSGCLPGPIRTEDAENRAGRGGEVEPEKGRGLAIALLEALGFDRIRHAALPVERTWYWSLSTLYV